MSSMRNAVQRRNHRERAQPKERERWGLLEKHKDYSLRAQDYNVKKARLRTLRAKAVERNPDEFHHGMLSSSTNKGRKVIDRGNLTLAHDAVKLLKTQDSCYLKTVLQKTQKQIQRLEEDFVFTSHTVNTVAIELDGPKTHGSKMVLCDNVDSQTQVEALLGQPPPRVQPVTSKKREYSQDQHKSRKQVEKERQSRKDDIAWRKKIRKAKDARRVKLTALKSRKVDLLAAEEELETQRAKMSNNIGGKNKAGVNFRPRERKK